AIIQDDVFKYCNQRYSDITGFSIKELLNMKSQGFLDLVHPDYQEKVQEQARLKQMGKKDGLIQVYEYKGIKKTGENYWGEIFSKTFNYRGFKAILISLIDITDRKKTEDKLKQMNEKLEDSVAKRTAELEISNEELRSFSYSISHDLKSPLRSISGFSQAIKEDYYDQIDNLGKDYLDRITKGCLKMSDLIDDLLKLSKVSRSDINFERFNYSEEIKSLVIELEERNSDKKYEIKLEDNIIIYGDKRLLKILARNLLENSFKFTDNKKKRKIIEIGTKKTSNNITYFFKDNGIGFDIHYADNIFLPFNRLHSPDKFPGSGIGLATVKRIIDRHYGKIWVESKINEGTSFFFTLNK
ncbi:MAG: PAS domain S-box protein, partial [archaeon]|nr:PAS domain S-box protein [archaeon]